MERLRDEAALATIEHGELPDEVRSAADRVAVVLTQSWCPDWTVMRDYLDSLTQDGLKVFYLEYDRESFFREFVQVKESGFGNALIPYVRYYRGGGLVAESNVEYSAAAFLKNFDRS